MRGGGVSKEWATEFITLFADDFLLQWSLTQAEDLVHMCRCVRATFDLLQDAGMTVNASKSKFIIQVQGGQAKRWLKQHLVRTADGAAISLGTPNRPLILPRVKSLAYLGVEASRGNFEMQTCRSRIKAGAAIWHRLIRVLHSSGLVVASTSHYLVPGLCA